MEWDYEVVVVGLGHAGCEAALAAARMGHRTLGVTLKREQIAAMSCNPAIGGTAKGHLVREIDALGGEMAWAADQAGTHFRTLNESKGAAVRATRVLCDRRAYAKAMQRAVFAQKRVDVLEGEAAGLRPTEVGPPRIVFKDKTEITAKKVILATGTFLRGRMHVGEASSAGGRQGEESSEGVTGSLEALGFRMGRFKTGTPPRLWRGSLDLSLLAPQPGDAMPKPFSLRAASLLTKEAIPFPARPQLLCHIAFTHGGTHEVVRRNLGRSPLYQGRIVGQGPRYCPSLEDKVVRFSDRTRHQVFLEPDGWDSELVYPAGLSTSLPAEVQLQFLRTMAGLEHVEVAEFGYAVEYDFALPTQLLPTLETRRVPGLYFAGQLNGTSGYEEAAFQGLVAGINAALSLEGRPPLVLGRHEAHGAVLVDELVTRGVDEPFRMLTSRSEHRLRLREGNADLRLRRHGARVGLVSESELAETEERRRAIESEVARLKETGLAKLLRRPQESYRSLADRDGSRPPLPPDVTLEVETELKYEGYLAQADSFLGGPKPWDEWEIPERLAFGEIRGLSREATEKLSRLRPASVAQARAISGLTPAALSLLIIHLRRLRESPPEGPGVENMLGAAPRQSGQTIRSG